MGTAGLHTKQESQNCLDNSKRLCRNVFVMVILNWSLSLSIVRLIDGSINQSINQSVNQSLNQSIHKSINPHF